MTASHGLIRLYIEIEMLGCIVCWKHSSTLPLQNHNLCSTYLKFLAIELKTQNHNLVICFFVCLEIDDALPVSYQEVSNVFVFRRLMFLCHLGLLHRYPPPSFLFLAGLSLTYCPRGFNTRTHVSLSKKYVFHCLKPFTLIYQMKNTQNLTTFYSHIHHNHNAYSVNASHLHN